MRLGFRLLLGNFVIVGVAAFAVLNVFVDEVKPGVRQAMEDSMVDTANLLAEMAGDDVRDGRIASGDFHRRWQAYRARSFNASVWGFNKKEPGLRLYITDQRGIVIYDSEQRALGQDYSRWNDVWLTLHGRYGVRSSLENGPDGTASIMHVAAPIRDQGRLLGVLTVARSNQTVQPFIERSQRKIIRAGWWLVAVSLLIGVAVALWLTWSVRRLVNYADAVSRGERVALPALAGGEIRSLGRALESMRERLEGKNYVEHYVTTLTHEMKSPLAAIQGAAELLDEDMPPSQRQRFLGHIREQSVRLRLFIDRMLALASLEQRQRLESPLAADLAQLVADTVQAAAGRAEQRGIRFDLDLQPVGLYSIDAFLLRQALNNLLENAMDFSDDGGEISISLQRVNGRLEIAVRDHGSGIPDYALEHVFERFYSLPRPSSGARSSGLGLSFVHEVMTLHGGGASVGNAHGGGALALLWLP